MGYPVVAVEGAVTSWGSANFYSTLLSRFSPMSARVLIAQEAVEVTELNTTFRASIPGLKSCTALLRGYSFATPALGNVGIVATSGSDYVTHVEGWTINIEANAIDITALNVDDTLSSGAPKWRRFRPDYSRWSGTYTAKIDSSTTLTTPPDAGGSLPTLTFTYGSNATLAGSAVITGVDVSEERGAAALVTYSFTGAGALTPGNSSSPLGSTAFGIPTWTAGGSRAGELVITTGNSKTLTVYDSFWRRLAITCRVGEAVMLEADVQGSGSVTTA